MLLEAHQFVVTLEATLTQALTKVLQLVLAFNGCFSKQAPAAVQSECHTSIWHQRCCGPTDVHEADTARRSGCILWAAAFNWIRTKTRGINCVKGARAVILRSVIRVCQCHTPRNGGGGARSTYIFAQHAPLAAVCATLPQGVNTKFFLPATLAPWMPVCTPNNCATPSQSSTLIVTPRNEQTCSGDQKYVDTQNSDAPSKT